MPDPLFGVAYLDAEDFRPSAKLFGVEMSFVSSYPDTEDGNAALDLVLQAASRAVDAFCGKVFTEDEITENHDLDTATWQFAVNNTPVASITSCLIRHSVNGTITIDPAKIYINNQKGYCQITWAISALDVIVAQLGTALTEAQIEVVYKSLQTVPNNVKLATGYQAGHMINSGYVDAKAPPNFGTVDIGGLKLNNRKGFKSAEDLQAASFSLDAERLLQGFRKFVAA